MKSFIQIPLITISSRTG